MDRARQGLSDEAAASPSALNPLTACRLCGEPESPLPALATRLLDGTALRRCRRCGSRWTDDPRQPRLVWLCESCGLPFVSAGEQRHARHRCEACLDGALPADLPDAVVAEATGAAIRAALGARWRFITAPGLDAYLDRIARTIAAAHPDAGAPKPCVRLFEDASARSLALPDGTVLLSTGQLEQFQDEAELAFQIGHDLAHAASLEAGMRLAYYGLQRVSRDRDGLEAVVWEEAAIDLLRLGYGRRHEHAADRSALAAMRRAGYDASAALSYLERLDAAIRNGSNDVAELALAHPPAGERRLRLGRDTALHDGVVPGCTNREPYRRAVVRALVAGELATRSFPGGAASAEDRRADDRRRRLVMTGAALLAALFLALALALRHWPLR